MQEPGAPNEAYDPERQRDFARKTLDREEAILAAILADMPRHFAMGDPDVGRWLSLARTHLEIGFMYLRQAIDPPSVGLGRNRI